MAQVLDLAKGRSGALDALNRGYRIIALTIFPALSQNQHYVS
jgi:hypothetical protein